jgi:hypothetical protein
MLILHRLHSDMNSFMTHPQRTSELVSEGPHELDARSSAPETPGAAPPVYVGRAFSFAGGGDGTPGVEKALRE